MSLEFPGTQIQEPVDDQNDFLYYLSLWDLECVFLIACCVIQASQPHGTTGASRVSSMLVLESKRIVGLEDQLKIRQSHVTKWPPKGLELSL